jgi:hypothetical protein
MKIEAFHGQSLFQNFHLVVVTSNNEKNMAGSQAPSHALSIALKYSLMKIETFRAFQSLCLFRDFVRCHGVTFRVLVELFTTPDGSWNSWNTRLRTFIWPGPFSRRHE